MLKLLLALLLVLSQSALAAEPPLRFAVSDGWAMPIAEFVNGRPVTGILIDLQRRMAQKVGRQAEFVVLPRLRLQRALDAGEVDVRCYVSPTWLNNDHYNYIWSLPFMTQRDVLVSTQPGQRKPSELSPQRFGTVHGYSYPELDALFARQQLQRDDARTQEQVLLKLSAQRYDYAVTNDLSLHWFNRALPAEQRLHIHSELASDPVACIVRNDEQVPTMRLLRAMVQMKEAGEFDAILARYR
ncbi:substrate-binding periplasmic protein [Pseudomonas sp. 5P_3.1_Bac2]|uniref:substrate-binding periplasmic protein n=1 Tax=Pseudomonas sp. 5P_3.1_Bac2 TaxID=2971617 RepID=UPI0021C8A675|nr:transporter substrate-binding domain-containing protein [Pseudomonas sp. 5P_3.1_Bac2]MCU1716386.1 transporter substrate-binding domain-containing protein [Pseudomonas sp. 5P_3.1_Bac2]